MCEYCEENKLMYKDDCNSHSVEFGLVKYPDRYKFRLNIFCGIQELSFTDFVKNINYCPMCGRKLN